jgi:RimJ/RimL family protein N-acetyltransferase
MWSHPDVTRHIGGKPSTEQQTWARILGYIGHWHVNGFGYWVIETKSGEFVGEVGFADFKRDISESMQGVPELGFALDTRYHGRGYASEAVAAAIAWADSRGWPRTVCLISPKNTASIRVATKFGYTIFEEALYNALPVLFLDRCIA